MRWFHRCSGKVVSVMHYTIESVDHKFGILPDYATPGTHTQALYRCTECGHLFVNTYPGKWSVEDLRAAR